MSRNDLIVAYQTGRLSRRTFIRGMMALGVSATVAVSLADKVRATPWGGNVSRWAAIEDTYGGDDTYEEPDDDDGEEPGGEDPGGEDPGGEDPGDGTDPGDDDDDDDPGTDPGDDDGEDTGGEDDGDDDDDAGGDDDGGDDDDDDSPDDDSDDDDDDSPDDDDNDDDDEVAGTHRLPSTGSGIAGVSSGVKNTLIGLGAAAAGIAVRLRRSLPIKSEE